MNIYIDESGLFVPSPAPDSWNVVGAYAASERSRKGMELALKNLKRAIGASEHAEIKLKNLNSDLSLYLQFLTTLARLDGVLYVAIADAYLDTTEIVEGHQVEFVKVMRKDAARMKREGTRQMISILADQLAALRPQLYAQLFHQTGLIELVARSAILFFAQRYPATLQVFRWRIDRKDTNLTEYEDAFRKIVPPLLQTRMMRRPLISIRGLDYSYMDRFLIPMPQYLRDDYGIDIEQSEGWDITKVFRTDLKFADSTTLTGLQIADLLASGVRRCLRGGFGPLNETAATLLGRLMVQAEKGDTSLTLGTFSPEPTLSVATRETILTMQRNVQRMILR